MNRRTFRLVLAAVPVLVIGGLGLGNQSATASNPQLEAARDALIAYVDDLNDLATIPALGTAVPGTSLKPIDSLRVGEIFDDLVNGLESEAIDTVGDLQDTLEARSGSLGDVGWFLGCEGSGPCSGDSGVLVSQAGSALTVRLPITLKDDDAAGRMSVDAGTFPVRDGSLPLDLSLTTAPVFTIALDGFLTTGTPAEVKAARDASIALAQTTTAQLSASLSSPVTFDYATTFGITDLKVVGNVGTASLGIGITLTDPDSTGGLTLDEALNTDVLDLVSSSLTPAPALSGSLTFDSPLIGAPDSAEATVTLGYDMSGVTVSAPDFSALNPFNNVTADGLLGGVGQLAAGLQSLSAGADAKLPFLSEGLATLTQLSKPFTDFVASQSVVCGSVDGTPPSGPIDASLPGLVFFCTAAAAAAVKPETIEWEITGGAVPFTEAQLPEFPAVTNKAGTFSTADTPLAERKRARFKTTGTPFSIRVKAVTVDGLQPVTANQPPTTATQLAQRLTEVAGFTAVPDQVTYSGTSKTLEVKLSRTYALPSSGPNATIDIGDALTESTKIVGLGAKTAPDEPTATMTVNATGITLDLRFGVILVDDVAQIDPDGTAFDGDDGKGYTNLPRGPHDRFYVGGPAGGGPFLKIDSATVNGSVNLGGTVGFVGVDVTGNLTIGKRTGDTSPTLAATFNPGPGIPVGAQTITGATTFRGLGVLDILDGTVVDPSLNARLDATLTGRALIDTGAPGSTPTELGSGGITVTLDDATNPAGLVVVADDFTSDLGGFANFDLTNPAALLSAVLDALRLVLDKIDLGTGTDGFDTAIPVLGVTPHDLFAQIDSIKSGIDELAGGPGPIVTCGNGFASGKVTGSPDGLVQADGITLSALRCQAILTKPLAEGTVPVWTVTSAALPTPVQVTGTADQVGTAGSPPAEAVSITVPAVTGGVLVANERPNGYRVTLSFTDSDGPHTAEVPSLGAPTNLQSLVDSLTAKLGFKPGFLAVDVVDVDRGGVDTQALTLRINAGLCSVDRVGDDMTIDPNECTAFDRILAEEETTYPVNLQLGEYGGVAGVDATGSLSASILARAKLGIAIPLEGDKDPLILGDSGLALQLQAGSDTLGFAANLGPLSVQLGTAVDTDPSADVTTPGLSTLKVGADLALARTTDNDALKAFTATDFFGPDFSLDVDASSQDCGTGKNYNAATMTDDDVALTGLACAKLAVGVAGTYAGEIGFAAGGLTSSFVVAVPQSVFDQLKNALFSLEFLLKTLEQLVGELKTTLSGAAADVKLPVVGNVLDAGAEVASNLENFISKLNSVLATPVSGSPAEFADAVEQTIYDAMVAGNITFLLRDTNASGGPDVGDITATAVCAGPCAPADTAASIKSLEIKLRLGQGNVGMQTCTGDGCDTDGVIPFDVGLDGLPVRVSGALLPKAGWDLLLNFGVDRFSGPFLVVNDAQPELRVGASIELAASPTSCLEDIDKSTEVGDVSVAALKNYSTDKCLSGTLGFLGVNLRDSTDNPSSIGINASLDLKNRGGGDRLTLNDLLGGQADAAFTAAANVNLQVRLRTGVKLGEGVSLPTVLGVLTISGGVTLSSEDGGSVTAPTVVFDTLYLDLGKTLSEFLGGIVGDIKRIVSPFKPIVDTLQAPLPVLSELAALVGKPPVTLIGLLEAVSGADLSLVKSFLSVLQFINNLPEPGSTLLVPLGDNTAMPGEQGGAFAVDTGAAASPQAPSDAGAKLVKGVENYADASDLLNSIGAAEDSPLDPGRDPYVDDADDPRPSTFGVKGLSFPLFTDASKIFNVLMGQDETMVFYEIGTLKASAGFNVTFGPFFIGPVPVSVFIGGSATIKGTFAFGYDTSGIRKVLDGASGEHLLDGIFLSDWDSAGNDVAEISLIGQVQAGAQVDLVVVKAGVEGGIRLTLDLNLRDDDHNGKLYIEEIFNKLSNPICLFDINGALDFFLNFFLEFDFFFFEKRFVFEILSIRLLDFSSSCDGSQPPKLAKQSGGTLTLLMGSSENRTERALAVDAIDEKFTVRPIRNEANGKLGYAVTAFGLTQEFGPAVDKDAAEITKVVARAGDGDDQVVMTNGASNEDEPETLYPNAQADFQGGYGKDVLKGGRAGDILSGAFEGGALPPIVGEDYAETADADVDTIAGNEGGDTIFGGPGADALNGDLGVDILDGQDGDDRVNGGGAGDRVIGGAGNDVLDGGPAPKVVTPPAPPAVLIDAVVDILDGENTLVGGPGNDAITGGPAKDVAYGDDELKDCTGTAETGFPGPDNNSDTDSMADVDTVDTGEGADEIYGGAGGDQLTGGPDADLICGAGGRDILEGDSPTNATNPGGDDLDGGPDNDVLFGRQGNDTLKGAGGNDRLIGDAGNDKQVGGDGNDVLDGAAGLDILLGDTGSIGLDPITADFAQRFALAAPDNVLGSGQFNCSRAVDGQGRLVAAGEGTADCVYGGGGNDIAFGDGGGDYVAGDDGDDYLDGGKGVDEMRGGQLNDTMFGREGDDDIFGDSGDDLIEGNEAVDEIRGGQGDDQIEGNQGADLIYGDSGQDNIAGGSDTEGVDDAGDTIFGGTEADTITGDNARIVRGVLPDKNDPEDNTAHARAVTLYDLSSTETSDFGADVIQGGDGNDRVYGQGAEDDILGGTGRDRLFGNEQVDTIRGELGDDLIVGGSEQTTESAAVADEGDFLFGGIGDDRIAGDNGSLSMTTGAFTPNVNEGAAFSGNDQIRGEDGLDVIYGQLEDDTIHGDAGQDRIIGDLGTISATTTSTDPDGVPVSTVELIKPNVGGLDTIFGDGDADRIWAGAASDTVEGNGGNDYLEGNGGEDFLYGFNATVDDGVDDGLADVVPLLVSGLGDDDDILGGSSSVNPGPRLDEGENLIQGNAGHDVILGDNGEVTRPIVDGDWVVDTIQTGLLRTIVLDDTDKDAAALDPVSGPDTIQGNAGNDEAFAEGGDDTVFGNDGDDVLVGNQDSDEIRGGDGQDDVVGGSLGGATATVDAVTNPRGLVAQGQLDDDDRLYGDAGADVVTGDNAQVIRPTQGSPWETDPVTLAGRRNVTLWDVQRGVSDTFSGNDLALGGPGIDRIMGQDGTDTLKGNEDADFIQGNQDRDLLEGNGGEDDLIGGHRIANLLDDADVIHGGEGADVAIGDNGVIDRAAEMTLGAAGNYYYETKQLFATKRFVQLYDVNSSDTEIAGGDQVSGGSQVDVLFGQGENDFVFGGADDDYLEGNSATDFMFGDKSRLEVVAARPAEMVDPLPELAASLPKEDLPPGLTPAQIAERDRPESLEPLLSGALSPDGQDDLIGGSSKDDRLDARDLQYGNGAADFLLGDNGRLDRTITDAAYLTYSEYDGADFRASLRFCTTGGQTSATCQPALRFGGDFQSGDAGNDRIWGQDGDDEQYGGTEHDDLYGELGKDRMFGQDGEDALLGDRGRIADTLLGSGQGITATTQGPTFFDYAGRFEGQLDRRVDLTRDVDLVKGVSNDTLLHPGMTEGGDDFMRGGRGHDSLHGAFGDDLMNGDSGGDYLFGHDGGDAIWGGKGSDNPATPNATEETGTPNAAVGWTKNNLIDIVFGGYGGSSTSVNGTFTGGSDILDWRPRPNVDPLAWLEITDTQNDVSDPAAIGDNQHHQGVDWIYGGYNRDVMQGNVGVNGPEPFGDRLLDWNGAYNLYSRCNASYGDDGDVRQHSPAMQQFLQKLAYGSGAGNVLGDLPSKTTSGGREMALVYPGDKDNSGKAYPGTPGNFDKPNCNAP